MHKNLRPLRHLVIHVSLLRRYMGSTSFKKRKEMAQTQTMTTLFHSVIPRFFPFSVSIHLMDVDDHINGTGVERSIKTMFMFFAFRIGKMRFILTFGVIIKVVKTDFVFKNAFFFFAQSCVQN